MDSFLCCFILSNNSFLIIRTEDKATGADSTERTREEKDRGGRERARSDIDDFEMQSVLSETDKVEI